MGIRQDIYPPFKGVHIQTQRSEPKVSHFWAYDLVSLTLVAEKLWKTMLKEYSCPVSEIRFYCRGSSDYLHRERSRALITSGVTKGPSSPENCLLCLCLLISTHPFWVIRAPGAVQKMLWILWHFIGKLCHLKWKQANHCWGHFFTVAWVVQSEEI